MTGTNCADLLSAETEMQRRSALAMAANRARYSLRELIGTAIRERRKALGLTLAELAERAKGEDGEGVSLGYLSQIELGKNSASIETLYRIALGLRIRVADLFNSIQTPV